MNFPQVSFLLHLILAVNIIIGVESRKLHQRERRSAISLPEGSTVTVTMDLIVPVVPLLNTTLTYLWFDLPLTFDVPTASNLNELYSSLGLIDGSSSQGKDEDEDDDSRSYTSLRDNFVEEQRASHEQRQVYRYVEGFFQNFGLNGKMCMKRAICELAEAPLGNHGLFGTIFELLFLPKQVEVHPSVEESFKNWTALPPELHFVKNSQEDEYTDALLKGRKMGNCPIHFPGCPISIFKLLDF